MSDPLLPQQRQNPRFTKWCAKIVVEIDKKAAFCRLFFKPVKQTLPDHVARSGLKHTTLPQFLRGRISALHWKAYPRKPIQMKVFSLSSRDFSPGATLFCQLGSRSILARSARYAFTRLSPPGRSTLKRIEEGNRVASNEHIPFSKIQSGNEDYFCQITNGLC